MSDRHASRLHQQRTVADAERGGGEVAYQLTSARIKEMLRARGEKAIGERSHSRDVDQHREPSPVRHTFEKCPICQTPMMQRTLELHYPQCYNAQLRALERTPSDASRAISSSMRFSARPQSAAEEAPAQQRSRSSARELVATNRPRSLNFMAPVSNVPPPTLAQLRTRSEGRHIRHENASNGNHGPTTRAMLHVDPQLSEAIESIRGSGGGDSAGGRGRDRERRYVSAPVESDDRVQQLSPQRPKTTSDVAMMLEEMQRRNQEDLEAHRSRSNSRGRRRVDQAAAPPATVVVASARRSMADVEKVSASITLRAHETTVDDEPQLRIDSTRPPRRVSDEDDEDETVEEARPLQLAPVPSALSASRFYTSERLPLRSRSASERVELVPQPVQRSPSPVDRASSIVTRELAYHGDGDVVQVGSQRRSGSGVGSQRMDVVASLRDVSSLIEQGRNSTKPIPRLHELMSTVSAPPPSVLLRAQQRSSSTKPANEQQSNAEAPPPQPQPPLAVAAPPATSAAPAAPQELPAKPPAPPKFCWSCGGGYPPGVVAKFCCECGAKVPGV